MQYLDDTEDDEPLTYDISSFVASAAPARSHVVELTDEVQSSVSYEQSVFVMKERGELLPLQKKKILIQANGRRISASLMKAGVNRVICRVKLTMFLFAQ